MQAVWFGRLRWITAWIQKSQILESQLIFIEKNQSRIWKNALAQDFLKCMGMRIYNLFVELWKKWTKLITVTLL